MTGAEYDPREADAVLGTVARIGQAAMRACATEGAELLVGEGQSDAPVRSGDLKASHTVIDNAVDEIGRVVRGRSARSVMRDLGRVGTIATIGATMDYSAVVHATHPTRAGWFTDAVRKNIRRIFEGVAKKAMEAEASKGTP